MDTFINKGDITIVFTPPEFQPYRESFDKTFKFVGTTIRDRLSTGSINYDNYDIYISIGSISSFNNTVNKGLLQRILSTEYMTYRDGSINGRKILVSGAESIANKLNNVECVKSTEQLRVLSNVDLFINHGGINSIFESLWFGVPQICIPMQEEQRMVALTMEKKGFVICADRQDLSIFEHKVNLDGKILNMQGDIIENAKILKSYDGTTKAVELIEQAANYKHKELEGKT